MLATYTDVEQFAMQVGSLSFRPAAGGSGNAQQKQLNGSANVQQKQLANSKRS
jgi:hypothetical protein